MGLAVAFVGAMIAGGLFAAGAVAGEVTSTDSIKANFNGQAVPAGDTVWFSSVIQWKGGSPTSLQHVHFVHQELTFTTKTSTWTVPVYSALLTFSSSATQASTTWNATAYRWDTVVPIKYTGDVFISGFAYHVGSEGLPAGTVVIWSGTFESSSACLHLNWKWAAAVYTDFAHNADIGVKPVDSNSLSAYQNSDHAGTPEYEKAYLTAGARGGGGSNFTGSYSGTVGVTKGTC